MSNGGILKHEELERDNAKSYDFIIPDEKLQQTWRTVGVAVLGKIRGLLFLAVPKGLNLHLLHVQEVVIHVKMIRYPSSG